MTRLGTGPHCSRSLVFNGLYDAYLGAGGDYFREFKVALREQRAVLLLAAFFARPITLALDP
jgi:hypothetical protein